LVQLDELAEKLRQVLLPDADAGILYRDFDEVVLSGFLQPFSMAGTDGE
jgi:hypothetical protein